MITTNFDYIKVKYRFITDWKQKNWSNGFFVKKNKLNVNEGSTCINYSQQCFEGLKCYFFKTKIINFKIERNLIRLQKSSKIILIPIIKILFNIRIIKILCIINSIYIPYSKYGFLYIRPLLIGVSNNLGVKSSKNFFYIVYCSPCFTNNKTKNYLKSINKQRVLKNMGGYKLGGNYIISLYNNLIIKVFGFNEIVYYNNMNFEEIGTSNIILFNNNKIYSMYNKNILFGTNRINILYLFNNYFKVSNLNITFNKINNSKILISCGTAIGIKKYYSILHYNKIVFFKNVKIFDFFKKIYFFWQNNKI